MFAQEKTKKVLDIWSKANTFPAAVITRLHKRVDGVKEGAYHVPVTLRVLCPTSVTMTEPPIYNAQSHLLRVSASS
jgi:protein NRD1